MGFLNDFKAFAVKGNVIDMAVGVVVGSAFSGIVNSLVSDIVMPVVGVLTGGINFTDYKVVLKEATESAEAVTLNYGTFIQTFVNFLIIAFSIFCVVRVMNKAKGRLEQLEKKKHEEEEAAAAAAKKAEEEAAAAKAAEEAAKAPSTEALLAEIRDLLKAKG